MQNIKSQLQNLFKRAKKGRDHCRIYIEYILNIYGINIIYRRRP